jgi:hypothetical protein
MPRQLVASGGGIKSREMKREMLWGEGKTTFCRGKGYEENIGLGR